MYIQTIHFSPRSWTGPDGETLLIPKDEGIGIMISYFQSRELCFRFAWGDLSDADLKIIKKLREDKAYMDKDSANPLQNGSAPRNICQENTFIWWYFLSIGIPTITKDVVSMNTLF